MLAGVVVVLAACREARAEASGFVALCSTAAGAALAQRKNARSTRVECMMAGLDCGSDRMHCQMEEDSTLARHKGIDNE